MLSKTSPILMWRFDAAPQEYQELSICGGDEDWLFFVPCDDEEDIPWVFDSKTFANKYVYRVEDGFIVITAHA
jgi:hypothetical protein